MFWILFVLTINSGGVGGIDKIPVMSQEACQALSGPLNERIAPGARYYAFCYPAAEEKALRDVQ